MAWIATALQILPMIPGLIDTGVKLADAVMRDPAVSAEDKAKLEADLAAARAALDALVERVKASRFTLPPA